MQTTHYTSHTAHISIQTTHYTFTQHSAHLSMQTTTHTLHTTYWPVLPCSLTLGPEMDPSGAQQQATTASYCALLHYYYLVLYVSTGGLFEAVQSSGTTSASLFLTTSLPLSNCTVV